MPQRLPAIAPRAHARKLMSRRRAQSAVKQRAPAKYTIWYARAQQRGGAELRYIGKCCMRSASSATSVVLPIAMTYSCRALIARLDRHIMKKRHPVRAKCKIRLTHRNIIFSRRSRYIARVLSGEHQRYIWRIRDFGVIIIIVRLL